MNIKNKILGALYGFAIGDSMGATTEFMTSEQIEKQYGQVNDLIGGGWLNIKPGEVTDDTQMMICVIDALIDVTKRSKGMKVIEKIEFQKKCMDNFVQWYKTKPKDVGGQCAKAINYYMAMGEYIGPDTNAQGNGSLMRALPCALLNAVELNVIQGKLTHNNAICTLRITRYNDMIRDCMYGIYDKKNYNCVKPSGWVVDTFECVKRHFSEANSFEQGIISAVNEGGDADTIAAITGGVLGAKFGFDHIPRCWIDKLDDEVKQKLNNFVDFIVR